jgi:signal transduction histidine kinase
MRIVIENAGAQTGFLLLQQNGQWLIQAKATINSNEVETSRSQTLEDSSEVAVGIIHYVARTKEYVVLNDATRAGNFANDPHIQTQQPKSVLCVPLINQTKLTSILYLENNLVSGVFTPERLELLYLLSSQMAISIENARLYADLEDKVKERTKNLAAQNAKLIVLNEKLVKVNQEKNEFLSIAAHDLKNPLSAIQGLAEMIVRDFDEMSKPEVLELANMISLSSQQMFELIKNLLDVNRLESGNLNISLGVFDILPVLEWVVKDYQDRAKTKNITLHFDGAEAEYYALGDERILRQVLDNLISNAVKYSPHGKQVYVRVSKDKKSVRCEIQDEGPGLSDEDKQQLFGKFTRLTPQPTGDENSTGLGLFIVKKLVEAMRGKVWCETELGKGATFIVEFRTEL